LWITPLLTALSMSETVGPSSEPLVSLSLAATAARRHSAGHAFPLIYDLPFNSSKLPLGKP
jgi:hypothetical protein